VALLAVAAVVAIALPIGVKAASTLVVIKDANTQEKAQVESGKLIVGDPNGRLGVNARTRASEGISTPAEGDDNNLTQGDAGALHGVVLDSGTATESVTLKLELRDTESPGTDPELVWQGTVAPGEHIGDFFNLAQGGIGSGTVLDADFTPNGGGGAQMVIYWESFPNNF
jgi:hypothetical protein